MIEKDIKAQAAESKRMLQRMKSSGAREFGPRKSWKQPKRL
jgi:hypothetical protein